MLMMNITCVFVSAFRCSTHLNIFIWVMCCVETKTKRNPKTMKRRKNERAKKNSAASIHNSLWLRMSIYMRYTLTYTARQAHLLYRNRHFIFVCKGVANSPIAAIFEITCISIYVGIIYGRFHSPAHTVNGFYSLSHLLLFRFRRRV